MTLSRILLIGGLAAASATTARAQLDVDYRGRDGLGVELYRPTFGKYAGAERLWTGVNILAQGLEFRFAQGRVGLTPGEYPGFTEERPPAPEAYGETHAGYELSVGAVLPILRPIVDGDLAVVYPVAGGQLGMYNLRPLRGTPNIGDNDQYVYLSAKAGLRVDLPVVSLELSATGQAGFTSVYFERAVRNFNLQPALTVRLDGLEGGLGALGRAKKSQTVSVSNVDRNSSTYRRNNADGTVTDVTTTTTSADVKTTAGSVRYRDIGGFLGVGPVYSYGSARRSDYTPVSRLFGANLQYKTGPGNFGLTAEFGRIGHATVTKGKKGRELDDTETQGRGTYAATQVYLDAGFDVSSYLLGLLGVVSDVSEGTQFFSIAAGLTQGLAVVGDQRFEDEAFAGDAAEAYYARAAGRLEGGDEPLTAKQYDPRAGATGRIGGWWIGADVGVASFRMRRLNYASARAARNVTFSFVYRVPLGRG